MILYTVAYFKQIHFCKFVQQLLNFFMLFLHCYKLKGHILNHEKDSKKPTMEIKHEMASLASHTLAVERRVWLPVLVEMTQFYKLCIHCTCYDK